MQTSIKFASACEFDHRKAFHISHFDFFEESASVNPMLFNGSAFADKGAGFRQIQQRYEPHPGTLRAIEIVENSPTCSKRPQPTAHASRDRAHHPQSTWNGIKENSGR